LLEVLRQSRKSREILVADGVMDKAWESFSGLLVQLLTMLPKMAIEW
jgi:hypothetical protein